MAEKKYYWLKLKENFFNEDDMKLIHDRENGAEYIIFWQKLLLKAITQNEIGVLRYKENIPYNPEILATVTDTDIDHVKSALKIFIELNMIELKENGDIWIDGIQELVGSETEWALKKRKHRAKLDTHNAKGDKVPPMSSECPTELELDIEIDKEKELKKNVEFDFESLYKQYPRKDGKKAALKHFKATVKTEEDYANIQKALNNYISHLKAEQTEPQFIKMASTWFNNWSDWTNYKVADFTNSSNPVKDKASNKLIDDIHEQKSKADKFRNNKKELGLSDAVNKKVKGEVMR